MAILLCAAMTFSVLPSAAAKAEDEEKVLEVVAEYDMSHGDGELRVITCHLQYFKNVCSLCSLII